MLSVGGELVVLGCWLQTRGSCWGNREGTPPQLVSEDADCGFSCPASLSPICFQNYPISFPKILHFYIHQKALVSLTWNQEALL